MNTEASRVHPNLVVDDLGFVRVLRIDREDKLGALSTNLVAALGIEFDKLANSNSIRSAILTGTGRGFIAGADIEEYAHATPAEFEHYQRFSREVFETLADLPQVTIAAVNGYAFGGGFELALCCDLIIASGRARFGLPEVKLGLIPGGGGLMRLAEAAGSRWAKEVIMSGRTVSPEEALERGIASEVIEEEHLLDRAISRAREFSANAPLAVGEVKALMQTSEKTRHAAAERDVHALVRLFASADGREGIEAFMEKRKAVFRAE